MARTLLVVLLALSTFGRAAERPNIVLIFCDDLGYGDLGCFGAKGWTTPNLDRLAGEGVRLTDFHVAQAVCSASRAALLTGCYANRVGIAGALGPGATHGIHAGETTLAEVCKSAGYATAIFGKWHLGHRPEFLPVRHGFDEWFGIPYSNDMWPYNAKARHLPMEQRLKRWPHLPFFEGEKVVNPQVMPADQETLTVELTRRAVSFIRRNREQPFFLYLAHPQPHVPLFVSKERQGKSAQGLYGDVIQEIDWSVGEILRTLEEGGIADDTWVIFTSDNGPWMVYGNHAGGVGPLRGCKGNSFEGGVRVPCVMRWPKRLQPATTVDVPVMTIDLLPTVAALLDVPLPGRKIDGVNIWKILTGEESKPAQPYFIYYAGNQLQAVRMGKWKLVLPHRYRESRTHPGRDGLPGSYRHLMAALALYDLEKDIGETTDVASEHPEVLQEMQALADAMRADLGDDLRKMKGPGRREPGRADPGR